MDFKKYGDIAKVIDKWDDLIQNKNAVCFGEERFDNELFRSAMLEAFNCFKNIKDNPQRVIPVGDCESLRVWDYFHLVQRISEYEADCYMDESQDFVFTASRMAARLLMDSIAYNFSYDLQNPILSGDFDYIVAERKYEYNVETGDLSDLMILAKLVMKI